MSVAEQLYTMLSEHQPFPVYRPPVPAKARNEGAFVVFLRTATEEGVTIGGTSDLIRASFSIAFHAKLMETAEQAAEVWLAWVRLYNSGSTGRIGKVYRVALTNRREVHNAELAPTEEGFQVTADLITGED